MSAPTSLPTDARQGSAALITQSLVLDRKISGDQLGHIRTQSAKCSSRGLHTQHSFKKRAASTDETIFRTREGKVILYYRSPVNLEEKKMHGFGAIGDGRCFDEYTNTKSGNLIQSISSKPLLSDLLDNSSPELIECSALIIGDSLETRDDLPMVTTSDMLPSPTRRRRTSGTLRGLIPQESPVKMHAYISPSPEGTGKPINSDNGLASSTTNVQKESVNEDETPQKAEIWMRQGHSFEQKMQWVCYGRITSNSRVNPSSSLDPSMYSLPFGVRKR